MNAVRFWVGVALIIANFIIGFLAKVIPLLYYKIGYYSLNVWIWIGFSVYAFSWLMLLVGVYLCGREGYNYAVTKYKEYQLRTVQSIKDQSQRTVSTIKDHSQRTYARVKEGVKKHIDKARKTRIKLH